MAKILSEVTLRTIRTDSDSYSGMPILLRRLSSRSLAALAVEQQQLCCAKVPSCSHLTRDVGTCFFGFPSLENLRS